MTRKERVIRVVQAVLENKRKIRDDYEKEGNKDRTSCYTKEIIEWMSFEWLLTDDHYLDKFEKIYIEENENEQTT